MIEVQCANCGKTLLRHPYRIKITKSHFCDQACYNAYRTNRLVANCKNCGKVFEYVPSTNREFCSQSCHMSWYWQNDPGAKERAKRNAKRIRATSKMPDRETLRRLHHDEGLTPKQIGELYGVQGQTARAWIYRSGIEFIVRYPGLEPSNKKPIPPKDVLNDLYVEQELTTIQIGKQFKVSSTTVGKWLKHYGIKARPSGNGLKARGMDGPTKKELYRMIHIDHLSYSQVAESYGVDLTAVPYWLDKYNIPRSQSWNRRHSEPEALEKMQDMYENGFSLSEIGDCFEGVKKAAVAQLFRENGITVRKDGFRGGRRFICNDGHKVRSSYELRVDNWLHEQGIDHEYEPSIPGEPYLRSDFLANGWYIEVWGVNGNPEYNEKKRKKQEIYRSLGLPLIEIPCHSFASSRNKLWIRKLQKVLEFPN